MRRNEIKRRRNCQGRRESWASLSGVIERQQKVGTGKRSAASAEWNHMFLIWKDAMLQNINDPLS